jgi:nucleoside-diphosphate-sugar epimerase
MKIFVTGGTGFIGSHFLKAAIAAGHEVVAIRNEASESRIPLVDQPRWRTAGLAEASKLFEEDDFRDVDVMVHLAAVGVLPKDASWFRCYQVNVQESMAVWKSAIAAGVRRIVSCGSCFEYGQAGERYERIPVGCPLEPIGPYASSKAAATLSLTGMARDMNFEAAVLRPFHVFGDGEDGGRLWPSLKSAALNGLDCPMTKGEQVRDMISVESCANAILDVAVNRGLEPGKPEIHNVGTGRATTVRAFAESWWSRWNASGHLVVGALAYRQGEVMRYVPELTLGREAEGIHGYEAAAAE